MLAHLKSRLLALPRIGRTRVCLLLLSVFFLLAALNFAVAWYYSGVLNELALQVRQNEVEYNLTASAVSENLVKLENGPDRGKWMSPGKWGLSWDGGNGEIGNGMIGDIVESADGSVVRQFTLADGDPPRSTSALLSGDIYPNDPYLAFGIEYAKVQYETPLGKQDAWQFARRPARHPARHPEGDDDPWVVFVHGLRGSPGDGLAILPILDDLGIPALFITYRNDKGQPQDPSGVYQYGLTEWQDLHAAVEYILGQPGANDVVLIGQSMGGGIVAKFLYESPLADSVTAAVLDSPMMDFKTTVELGGRQRNLPGFVTATATWISNLRFGLDWDAMDYLKDSHRLDIPILLIHGDDDTRVPIETSDKLSHLRPDLITYTVYPNTPHANAWNTDSTRYEQELRDFLLRVAN